MILILKNNRSENDITKNVYIIFNTANKTKTNIELTSADASDLKNAYNMRIISPLDVYSYFDFDRVDIDKLNISNFILPNKVEEIFPPFSDERREVRKNWNAQLDNEDGYKNWYRFLFVQAYLKSLPELPF